MIDNLLYVLGHLIVWYGAFVQMFKVHNSKSTKSIALIWLITSSVSMALRLPAALASNLWAFQWTYVIGFLLGLILLGIVVYNRRKYPNE